MFSFQKRYFLVAFLLFLLLLAIAAFVHDSVIRPYGGDLLVILFLYYLLKSFLRLGVKTAVFGVLAFAIIIEVLQFLNTLKFLGWEKIEGANIILGSHFDWLDIFSYVLGGALVLGMEQKREN